MREERDYEAIGRQLIRALRAHRSQTAFSRYLGYTSNVVYTWEAGRRWPTASETLRVAARSGVDLGERLARFYRDPPEWVARADLTTTSTVARILRDLRGRRKIGEISEDSGMSRFQISRWLRGEADPRLPELLALVDAMSVRFLDVVAIFVDPAELPALRPAWKRLEATRRAAYDLPWTQAVLRVLEVEDYCTLESHRPGFVAQRLGIDLDEERRCLEVLEASGQIRLRRGRYEVQDVAAAVDTRRNPEESRRLRAHWMDVARQQFEAGSDGLFGYNVFCCSEDDLAKLRALQIAYFDELRAIVERSEPAERVVVATVQLFGLDEGAGGRRGGPNSGSAN